MHEFTDLLQFLAMLCAPIATVAIAVPVGRAIARQMRERQSPPVEPLSDAVYHVQDRLARLETAIDAIAVELERQGETQRYAARLLELRASISLPDAPAKQIGSITPH
jgi:hypothetical protein